MVKPIDITRTVIVPKPHTKKEELKSFFIGHVDQVIESTTTDIEVDTKDRVVYKCIKSKANIEIYMGEKKITSLILE